MCFPPGRKKGQRCGVSLFPSTFVTAAGDPPDAATRASPIRMSGAKTMTPVELHVPPRALGASQIVWIGPPDASAIFSFPPEKNPIDRLSGDQKGNFPPSTTGRAATAPVRSDWTHSLEPAPKTARSPSGDRTIGAESSPVRWNIAFSGGTRKECTAAGRWLRSRPDGRDRGGLARHDRRDQRRLARSREGLPAGRHLVEDRPQGEYVRSDIGFPSLELLGRHVLKRPEDRALIRQRTGLHRRQAGHPGRLLDRLHRLGQAEGLELDGRLRQHSV